MLKRAENGVPQRVGEKVTHPDFQKGEDVVPPCAWGEKVPSKGSFGVESEKRKLFFSVRDQRRINQGLCETGNRKVQIKLDEVICV
jgi:hypothetical protein